MSIGWKSQRFELFSQFTENKYDAVSVIKREPNCFLSPLSWFSNSERYHISHLVDGSEILIGKIEITTSKNAYIYNIQSNDQRDNGTRFNSIIQKRHYDKDKALFLTRYDNASTEFSKNVQLIDVS
jgi:hypothetical protein